MLFPQMTFEVIASRAIPIALRHRTFRSKVLMLDAIVIHAALRRLEVLCAARKCAFAFDSSQMNGFSMLVELLLCLELLVATVKVARQSRLEVRSFVLAQQLGRSKEFATVLTHEILSFGVVEVGELEVFITFVLVRVDFRTDLTFCTCELAMHRLDVHLQT